MRRVFWLWVGLVPLLASAQGAVPIRDIRLTPGMTQPGSDPQYLTAFRGGVVFSAARGLDREVWWSDGTPAGTYLLKDLTLGTEPSNPHDFAIAGASLYFISRPNPSFRQEALFISDGTTAGTRLVSLIPEATQLRALGSRVFFVTWASGPTLWTSDGTAAGTVPLHSVGTGSYPPNVFLTPVGTTLFFVNYDSSLGAELWKSDGTEAGTVLVKDISTGLGASSSPSELTVVGNTLYFIATEYYSGTELWKSDGTEAGTVMVKDLYPGASSSVDPIYIWFSKAALGSTFYFTGFDGTVGTVLWRTDGTAAGTVMVRSPTTIPSGTQLAPAGSTMFFTAFSSETTGEQLWKTDGTTAGTMLVKALPYEGNPIWSKLTASGSRLFLVADTMATGKELWTSDGTAAGTVLTRDIDTADTSSSPSEPVSLGTTTVFAANDGLKGTELWKTDGTAAGTVMLQDILLGSGSSNPSLLTRVGSTVFFVADDGVIGQELWKTDGTAAGTVLVKDLYPGSGSSQPFEMIAVGSTLYFFANDGMRGTELWKSDGTAAGTVLVKDINPGAGSSVGYYAGYHSLIAVDGLLYFYGSNGTQGGEVWKSDGTAAGTVMVKDARPGYESLSLGAIDFQRAGSYVYFNAWWGTTSGGYRGELWRTDGTSAGTILLATFSEYGTPIALTEHQGNLFFIGNEHQLWKSDGTTAGTSMVFDWAPSVYLYEEPTWIRSLGTTLLFTANDQVHGTELWTSDGTTAGTARLTDLAPGGDSSVGGVIATGAGKVWFVGTDGSEGAELWETDGTLARTRRVHDIAAGGFSSNPSPAAIAGGALVFAATDASGDRELWKYVVDATPPRIVPTVAGTLGGGGWYTSDVSVSFSLSDPETPVTDPMGCAPFVLSADTAGRVLTCTASSWGGSTSSTVMIKRDTTAPVITCPADQQAEATSPSGALVSVPRPSAQDALDPSPMVSTSVASGSRLPLGAQLVTASATDEAGNASSCTFMVTVRDTTAPALGCPAEVKATATQTGEAAVSFSVTATDSADAAPRLDYSHASGSSFPMGETVVTVTATDASGNSASCTFPVRVSAGGGGGCGCSNTAAVPELGWALLLGAAVLARRGRRLTSTGRRSPSAPRP